jgi:hypothetical protein
LQTLKSCAKIAIRQYGNNHPKLGELSMINYPTHVQDALNELYSKGFAIAIFSPKELHGVDTETVETTMIGEGWNAIHYFKDPNVEEFNWEDETEDYPA